MQTTYISASLCQAGLKAKSMDGIKALFEPRRVVLVGSSKLQEEIGMVSPRLFRDVTHNMRRFFQGATYVLDTDGEEPYNKFKELPEIPELAVILLPPKQSIEHIEESARLGVRSVIIIAGGFREEHRQRLLQIKEEWGIRILGPNTIMGVINTANGLNTTFAKDIMPEKGNIAVISQSGGVGACLLDWACFNNIGISKFAFVGDKMDINDVELMRYYGKDRKTNAICIYMEGVKDGRRFMQEARKIVTKKPILALKGGTTKKSAERVKSHTASIAGSDTIFEAAFKKAGIIRVGDIEEMLNAAIALSKQPPMRGDNLAIVSNVGGPAILAADVAEESSLKLAVLSEKTKTDIETLYPGVDATNPIDIIADAKAERYFKVLDLVLKDKNVDAVLVINMLKSCFFEPEDAKAIKNIANKYKNKPIVDVPAGGEDFFKIHRVLGKTRIPLFNLPEKAVKALKHSRAYGKILEKH